MGVALSQSSAVQSWKGARQKRRVRRLKRRGDVSGLIDALGYESSDPDSVEAVRRGAATALGEIGDARAVEPLIAALENAYSDVQTSAARALGKLGDVRAVEPLIAKLGRYNLQDLATTEALGRLGDRRAVAPLMAFCAFSPDPYEGSALSERGRQSDPDDEHRWEERARDAAYGALVEIDSTLEEEASAARRKPKAWRAAADEFGSRLPIGVGATAGEHQAAAGMLAAARRMIEPNLAAARFLASTQPFGLAEMKTYIKLSEEWMDTPFDPVQKKQLLTSPTHIIGGFETVREDILSVHLQAIQTGIRILNEAVRDPATMPQALEYLGSVLVRLPSEIESRTDVLEGIDEDVEATSRAARGATLESSAGNSGRVVDLRSEQEKQAEDDARAPLGEPDERLARELVELLAEAPDRLYDSDQATPAEQAIRAIGEKLCADGGNERMVRVACRVQAIGYPDARIRGLELKWNGICGWSW